MNTKPTIYMCAEVAIALGLRHHVAVRHPATVDRVSRVGSDRHQIEISVPIPGTDAVTILIIYVAPGWARDRLLERLGGRLPLEDELVTAGLEVDYVTREGRPYVSVRHLEPAVPEPPVKTEKRTIYEENVLPRGTP